MFDQLDKLELSRIHAATEHELRFIIYN
uniref:Uncharacterized protein n=1 Tax=Arundo donax TaxID=35708 RepID=A0A0A9AD56_ARUDO